MSEKILHAFIKDYIEPDKSKQEIRIGNFIADIVTDSSITEIQTRDFNKLRKRLEFFLNTHTVTLVYPIPRYKWLCWINPETNEMTKKRKSPRTGRIYDAIGEIYKIKQFLNHQNFRLCLIFIDIEEYRHLDGWSNDKKKGSTRHDRIPVKIIEEINIDNINAYSIFIPDSLGALDKSFSPNFKACVDSSTVA